MEFEKINNAIGRGILKGLYEAGNKKPEKYEMEIGEDIHRIYIGDPCYIVPDEVYDENVADQQGILPDGLGIVHGTYIGDGDYKSNVCSRSYWVDSGSIAVITCGGQLFWQEPVDERYSREFEMSKGTHKLALIYDHDGTFTFKLDGKIIEQIYTGIR